MYIHIILFYNVIYSFVRQDKTSTITFFVYMQSMSSHSMLPELCSGASAVEVCVCFMNRILNHILRFVSRYQNISSCIPSVNRG